jgi:hypothetical protein
MQHQGFLIVKRRLSINLRWSSLICLIKILQKKKLESSTMNRKQKFYCTCAKITTRKDIWMKESYRQILLDAAEKNPIEALARWQKVPGDYSFMS